MHEVDWTSLGSTLFGGALSMALARAYIAKLLATVDALEAAVKQLSTALAVLTVRAEKVADLEKGQAKHDRKIAALEAVVHGSRNPRDSSEDS